MSTFLTGVYDEEYPMTEYELLYHPENFTVYTIDDKYTEYMNDLMKLLSTYLEKNICIYIIQSYMYNPIYTKNLKKNDIYIQKSYMNMNIGMFVDGTYFCKVGLFYYRSYDLINIKDTIMTNTHSRYFNDQYELCKKNKDNDELCYLKKFK